MARYRITGKLPKNIKLDEDINKIGNGIANKIINKIEHIDVIVDLSIAETMVVRGKILDINKKYGTKFVMSKMLIQ